MNVMRLGCNPKVKSYQEGYFIHLVKLERVPLRFIWGKGGSY